MSEELNPRARALLQAARRAPCAPSPEANARVENAVLLAVGVSGAAAGAGAAKAASALGGAGLLTKGVVGAVLLVLAASGVVVALSRRAAQERSRSVPAPLIASIPALEPPVPSEAATEPALVPAPLIAAIPAADRPVPTREAAPAPAPMTTPMVTPPPESRFAQELALLQSAKGQFEAGSWADVLTTIARYDAQFPAGSLRDEAEVLSVLSLCSLGREGEALPRATKLRERATGSPALIRLAGSCVDP